MLVTPFVAVIVIWLALAAFGSGPDIRANAPAAAQPIALLRAAQVTEPSPISPPSIVQALPAAAPTVVPRPVSAAPEMGGLSFIAVVMASLPPDAAKPRVARLAPFASEFASAPFGAATPASVPPPSCKSTSLSPDAVPADGVPLPPRRPPEPTQSHRAPPAEAARVLVTPHAVPLPPQRPPEPAESHPAPPAEAARVPAAEPSPTAIELAPDAQPPGESTIQQTMATPPATAVSAPPESRDILQGIFGTSFQPPAPCAGMAVYDITAHTVYMPNGERLEAHSGLGRNLDDPSSFSLKNRGVLPPQTYALTPRKQLFHGIAALRLEPVGDGDMHGRVGMLAHTYMRGPRGDSNGCLSLKNYDKFLAAYHSGEVSRLLVMTHVAWDKGEAGARAGEGPGHPSEGFFDMR